MKKIAIVMSIILIIMLILTACGDRDHTDVTFPLVSNAPSTFKTGSTPTYSVPSVTEKNGSNASVSKPLSVSDTRQNKEAIQDIMNKIKDADNYLKNEELPDIDIP